MYETKDRRRSSQEHRKQGRLARSHRRIIIMLAQLAQGRHHRAPSKMVGAPCACKRSGPCSVKGRANAVSVAEQVPG